MFFAGYQSVLAVQLIQFRPSWPAISYSHLPQNWAFHLLAAQSLINSVFSVNSLAIFCSYFSHAWASATLRIAPLLRPQANVYSRVYGTDNQQIGFDFSAVSLYLR